ncbi:MAG: BON domain-containing protein [Planctomycetota bacterium]|nr:BON domain-containing protein [Planctomycetota bacterium]
MVGKRVSRCVVWVCLLMALAARADGQLFGERRLGQTLQRRAGRAASPATGNARFLRGSRSRSEFVGNRGRNDSATAPARNNRQAGRPPQPRVTRNLNPTLPKQPRKAPYYPKLSVAFAVSSPTEAAQGAELASRLTRLFPAVSESRFEVLVAGRRARLRGAVASAHQRELAEIVARFSPGISEIQNELTIQPPVAVPPPVPTPPD